MSDLQSLQLNLSDFNKYYNNDDEEFHSVNSSIGEDKDTYRVLDEAMIGSNELYGPDLFRNNYDEGRFVEMPPAIDEDKSFRPLNHFEITAPAKPLLPEKTDGTAPPANMFRPMNVINAREMEELRKEKDYQLEMKKRISDEMKRDTDYSLDKLINNIDDNNNNNNTYDRDDHEEHQKRDIEFSQHNTTPIEFETNEENILYDSIEAEQSSRMNELKMFSSSNNSSHPSFNEANLVQFYPKSPQKEVKSSGPVKGDHMILSQMWSDDQLYHEFEKMANDYNENQSHHDPNVALFSGQGKEHFQHPSHSDPSSDFQGTDNPPEHEETSREQLWKNLSEKQPTPKTNPITMDFVRKPKFVPKPLTNYVEYNKVNYTKAGQNQSYRARHNLRKDIGGSISRIPQERTIYSGRSEPIHRGPEQSKLPGLQKPSSAEDSWKKNSAKLLYQMEKKLPPPPGKLQKYPSDSRVNYRNTRPHYLQPLNLSGQQCQDLVPVEQKAGNKSQTIIGLEPITKDFVMEDGQRISVDISLKLLSPPVSNRVSNNETSTKTIQSQPPFNANEQTISLTTNLKNFNSTISKEQAEKFPLPSNHEKFVTSDYQGPNNTEESLNSKVGYAARYQRTRDPKPNYKVYSVGDYRKMQKEVKLGKLGPDLDDETLKEKVEKRQKQFEYAKRVYATNKEYLKSQKPAAPPQPKQLITEEQKNRRKLAIEYAKSVPKPTVKPPSMLTVLETGMLNTHKQLPPIGRAQSPNKKNSAHLMDSEELEKLRQRHEQDKKNAENIRKKITPS